MIVGLLPILLLNTIIVLLIACAAVLYRYTERNKMQKILIGIVVLWTVLFLGLSVNLFCDYDGKEFPVAGVLNFRGIWLGLIGLFSLISYPAMALHRPLIRLKKTLLWLSPVLAALLVYAVWHAVNGVSMNYIYSSYAELWANRCTVPVVLRALMLLFFNVYLVLMLLHIWQLIPIYEKYCEDNYSDTAHNVGWMRLVVLAIGSICLAYEILLVWKDPVGQILYAVVVGFFFVLLTVNAVSHKHFAESEYIEVRWSFRQGWQLVEKERPKEEKIDYDALTLLLDRWMFVEKPFQNPDFTAAHIYARFPELRYPVLTELLSRKGLTFQSYVRQLRIEEVCRLMDESPHLLCKEIAYRVGFSSSQALSRAFIAVKGTTPKDFRKHNL